MANNQVWKFNFVLWDLADGGVVAWPMPAGAQPLMVREQGENLCLWAEVDPAMPLVQRRFRVAGTGHDLPAGEDRHYVGSGLLRGGNLVLHVWELGDLA